MSESQHTVRQPLDIGRQSAVYWSLTSPRDALVFVHGFRGSGLLSWGTAPSLLTARPWSAHYDLYFFDYESKRHQVPRLAADVRDLLLAVSEFGSALGAPAALRSLRPDGFRYDRIVVVSHSLGAILVRRAILDALKLGASWPQTVRLLMFAPAHLGARVRTLLHYTIGKCRAPFEALVRTIYPVLDELEAGSTTLELLLGDSRVVAAACPLGVTARSVGIADIEQVVDSNAFFDDPPGVVLRNTNHMTIIKAGAPDCIQFQTLEEWTDPTKLA